MGKNENEQKEAGFGLYFFKKKFTSLCGLFRCFFFSSSFSLKFSKKEKRLASGAISSMSSSTSSSAAIWNFRELVSCEQDLRELSSSKVIKFRELCSNRTVDLFS